MDYKYAPSDDLFFFLSSLSRSPSSSPFPSTSPIPPSPPSNPPSPSSSSSSSPSPLSSPSPSTSPSSSPPSPPPSIPPISNPNATPSRPLSPLSPPLSLSRSLSLFLSEFALAASLCLQGLWSLQTGLFVNVERFVPKGCHRLLEVRDGAVRCELEESRVRVGRIVELAFGVHVLIVAVVAVGVYVGVGWRRGNGGGAYEALPTSSGNGVGRELEHVQMRAMGKSSMQA